MASIKAVVSNKIYSNGKTPVLLRLTENRKSTYKTTGIEIDPSHWDKSKSKISSKHPDSRKLNHLIQEHISKIENELIELNLENKPVNASEILKPTRSKQVSFLTYANEYIEIRRAKGQFRTAEKYQGYIDSIEKYQKNKGLDFHEITEIWIANFANYCQQILGNSSGTIHRKFAFLTGIYSEALKRQLTTGSNPFYLVQFSVDKKSKAKLSELEFERFANVNLDINQRICHARDVFMFQFYLRGTRISDVLNLKIENIKTDRIEFYMDKTNNFVSVKIIPQLQKIIDLYKNKSPFGYLFPILTYEYDKQKTPHENEQIRLKNIESSTATINYHLKRVAKMAEIPHNLSSHVARHTFADMARRKKMNLYDISKALGHSTLKMTENYMASLDNESLDKTLDDFYA